VKTQDRKVGRRVKPSPLRAPSTRWLRTRRPIPKPIMRVYRLQPDYANPLVRVEVRLFRTQHAMLEAHRVSEGRRHRLSLEDCWTDGWCKSYYSRITRVDRPVLIWRHVVARIYLCAPAVARRRVEVPTHEVGHAAMAYARYRRANLSVMEGEEVMCYALGRMITQLTSVLHATGFYEGMLR